MLAVMKMKQEFVHTIGQKLSIPTEAMTQQVCICLRGKRSVSVEHHRGILEYSKERVRISVHRGAICIIGTELTVTRMSERTLELCGRIERVELE